MRIVSSALVQAPAAQVWAFIEHYANDPRWRTGVSRMQQVTDGPVHAGAEVDEVIRILGRTIRSRVVVGSVEPGRSFTWRVIGGARASGRRWVRALDEHSSELGTEKTLLLTGADRILAPIVAAVTRRAELEDVRRAAALIESASSDHKRSLV